MSPLTIFEGDALERLKELEANSVHCCVTSPPYWGLRDYSSNGQLGLEKTPEEYVGRMVEIFREVRRVLRKDGTLWLNLGDSYANDTKWGGSTGGKHANGLHGETGIGRQKTITGLKPKDLIGIPWRVAFALQADGWYLRQDIIWAKPNPMPESVTDRPTKAHEYLFLLTKSPRYFYDAEAIKEKAEESSGGWQSRARSGLETQSAATIKCDDRNDGGACIGPNRAASSRNKRSVWTVATAPYPEAHFATYPPDLIKPCILAGTSAKGCCAKCGAPWERITQQTGPSTYAKIKGDRSWREMSAVANEQGTTPSRPNSGQTRFENGTQPHLDAAPTKTLGWQPTCECAIKSHNPFSTYNSPAIPCTVIDPFAGSGTTGAVALELGRHAVLIELNPNYITLIRQRCDVTLGLALA
jgi:DNA modification methylase